MGITFWSQLPEATWGTAVFDALFLRLPLLVAWTQYYEYFISLYIKLKCKSIKHVITRDFNQYTFCYHQNCLQQLR